MDFRFRWWNVVKTRTNSQTRKIIIKLMRLNLIVTKINVTKSKQVLGFEIKMSYDVGLRVLFAPFEYGTLRVSQGRQSARTVSNQILMTIIKLNTKDTSSAM